jgi:hypothetical protein
METEINAIAYKVLFLLKDYLVEFKDSELSPNTVLIGDNYYSAIKEAFPEMVIGNKLLYNNRSLEICVTKEENIIGLAYSYHNEWK